MFDPRGPEVDWADELIDPEFKGGKPSKGTPADQRLKENKPSGKKPRKPAFPGAAPMFGADDGHQSGSKNNKQ